MAQGFVNCRNGGSVYATELRNVPQTKNPVLVFNRTVRRGKESGKKSCRVHRKNERHEGRGQ